MAGIVAPALRALLEQIIDYAGMFPPAKLPLADALENFHEYQHHEHADYLSRFVIPVGQVPDLPSVPRNDNSTDHER